MVSFFVWALAMSDNSFIKDLLREDRFFYPLLAAIIFFIFWFFFNLFRKSFIRSNRATASLQQQVLLIKVPKVSVKEKTGEVTSKDIQEEIGVTENLFAILGGLRAQRGLGSWLAGRTDQLAFEIVSLAGSVNFYIAVPNLLAESLKQQLVAVYPHAQIEAVADYNFFSPQGFVAGACLRLSREYIFPIKTFRKMEGDPLEGLIVPLGKIPNGDGAGIQFVIRSAHKRWHRKGVLVAREVQQGKTVLQALRQAGFGSYSDKFFHLLSGLFTFFSAKPKKDQDKSKLEEQQHRLSPMEVDVIKGIEEKTSKAGFDVNIRIVTSSVSKDQAVNYLNEIINSFGQYSIYQFGNSLKSVRPRNIDGLVSDFIHRFFDERYKLILNSEEMTSLWHLPLPSTEAPNIHWLEARKSPPPLNLPLAGILLGENVYRGQKTPVRIKAEDRQRHVYMIGKSGTGKSVLQANMIVQDINNGDGVCVIDPHGDLIEAVIDKVPEARVDDVIYFDPADYQRPIGVNMLEFQNPEQKTFVINEMIKIFDKLYDLKATGGPMFEQYMRNAILLMMEDKESGATLMEVPKVLADANFRKYKLTKCVNPVVRDFWEKEAEKAGGEAALANMVPYITSKLTPFVSSDLLRPIIAQQQSSFNFRQAMDERKIVLVKLSKGIIGELSCHLLGMIIVGKLLLAALSRVDQPEAQRTNFYLYIDEFQNFTTDTISIILSEARKYKLCLTIAHQYIGQLVKENDSSIRDAVFGNIGTMIAFRIGPDDAEIVAKQFAPVFNEYDVINIPKYNAYIKLLIDNENPPAFNLATWPPQAGDLALANRIKELSRFRYGRDRSEVEQEILNRITMTAPKPAAPTII